MESQNRRLKFTQVRNGDIENSPYLFICLFNKLHNHET